MTLPASPCPSFPGDWRQRNTSNIGKGSGSNLSEGSHPLGIANRSRWIHRPKSSASNQPNTAGADPDSQRRERLTAINRVKILVSRFHINPDAVIGARQSPADTIQALQQRSSRQQYPFELPFERNLLCQPCLNLAVTQRYVISLHVRSRSRKNVGPAHGNYCTGLVCKILVRHPRRT